MKTKLIIVILLIGVLLPVEAQHKRFNGSSEKIKNKIEELEKIKLIEILDLKEEDMIKFFSRRKDYIDKSHQLEEKRNKLIDALRENLDESNEQKIKIMTDEISATDESIFNNRRDFIYSLKDILTAKQIAKLIVFERNFKKELKELLLKKRNNRS